MFNPLGLFRGITCPEEGRCTILNCIFAHSDKELCEPTTLATRDTSSASGPARSSSNSTPPLKRKREDDAADETKSQAVGSEHASPKAQKAPKAQKPEPHTKPSLQSTATRVSPPPSKNGALHSTEKVVPVAPAKGTMTTPGSNHQPRPVKKESLNPRHLSKPPASHQVRMSILSKLHEGMTRLNDLIRKDNDTSKKGLLLSEDELVSMALDEEEKTAKENTSVYSNVIKLRIVKLKKMTQRDWEEDVMTYLQQKSEVTTADAPAAAPKPRQEISTGLGSKQEVEILMSRLITPRDALTKLGVVTTAPTPEDVRLAKSGADSAQGWEMCDRCEGRFQVYPGRREDGVLASGGTCCYHYGKPIRPPRKKTDHIVGQQEPYYSCCNEPVGESPGCTKSQYHVFKIADPKRLAAIEQFQDTPTQPDKPALPPVCFDCEMGYTTLGLELIRLTAISWPQGKKMLDVLVRPFGEVLDLNTRFSGVSPEHFAHAIPYGTAKGTTTDDANTPDTTAVLEVVESPSVARKLLFEHLQPDTPLLAHSIENDLSACRIIHPTIVDTAQLYPHPGGLPYRYGLRMLARKYLEREIQTGGGTKGHDSMEDARATGDLVRVKVGETWKRLKRDGWEVKNGGLVASTSTSSAATSVGHLVSSGAAGSDQKEK